MNRAKRSLRILVLDDQKAILRLLEAQLEARGHSVFTTDAWLRLSVEIARKPSPDVVILDLNMPALPGERIAPIVRQYAPDAALIIFSGESGTRLDEAKGVFASDYVFRKNEIAKLISVVEEIAVAECV